ncbi:HigA family addiction module antitoxin [Dyadobacter chenwenxiniae]|uniref:HigA family addiction module antitoxin n=1 Tax=Dyadobacter chenwenxiniae TaxID=2906456 RepID=A0A9X1THU5_9BACT|nr:HigA family addiction module antitoxin [Dyadobacter chenwenxiniae]MCF0065487.1 HigA family addiction module antitoxin [Dyadobacter chenwenxiniae]UON82105.1 HigA family addiction module antitoxin [Dyadobacter chenwenxiniae]
MAIFDPAHPGELIRETLDGLREEGYQFTIEQVALSLGTTRKTLSAIINGKSNLSPEMAVRLAAGFPNTTAEFWMKVQQNFDLAKAKNKVDISAIKPLWTASETTYQHMKS